MKQTVVCYKTRKPVIYNAGTKYESSCDEFLAYVANMPIEAAKLQCEKLNIETPKTMPTGEVIDWSKVAYFYATEQEEMI